jgi:16S rRNA (uracil1498-N3)-methyltransferase
MPSFYVDFCERDQEIEIIADEYHHIINVFRYTIGDEISILNGKGLIAAGIIKKIEKKSLLLNVTHIRYYKRNEFKVACAFSLLKNKHDLFIVEKLTELGVCDLFPMQTKNSIKLSKENTIDKMMKTAITAMKQCNNPWLPTIHEFG